jgi:NAD(P)H-hydrate epimerase
MRADAAAATLDAAYCRDLLPRRDPEGHKFTFGRVVAVCGSLEYAGAAYLAALGAARGGAGLVAMAVPVSLRQALAGRLPEAVLVGLPETAEGEVDVAGALARLAEREADALVVGPGLKETAEYRELVLSLLRQAGSPAVVDAGALNMLAGSRGWEASTDRDLVLTPHPGEFARLTGTDVGADDGERLDRAMATASELGQVVVLKGARTVVAAPDGRAAVSTVANAALATAGSGDVLSGLIGALIAQGAAPFDAAAVGVYLHGRAGERLSWRLGDAGVLASDIAHEVPLARHELAQHST